MAQQNGGATLSPHFKLSFLTGGVVAVIASINMHKRC